MQRLVIFCVCAFAASLPIRSQAAEATTSAIQIASLSIQYPKLDTGYIPNTFSYPYQTAFKDGDETTITAQVRTDTLPATVVADGTALGAGTISFYDTGMSAGSVHQFQSSSFVIRPSRANGTYAIPVTATAGGATTTSSLRIVIDTAPPRFSLSIFARAASSTPRQGDLLSLSGAIDGTGTLGRLFSILVRVTDAAGAALSTGNEYYSSQLGSALRDLRNGIFSNLTLPILEESSALARAAAVHLFLMGKDEAGNVGTTSAVLLIHASSSPAVPAPDTSGTPGSTTASSVSNVLFLPGIESSRLYSSAEAKLWEPSRNEDIVSMALDENGKSMQPVHAREGDVIRTARLSLPVPLSKDLYASFFSDLDQLRADGAMTAWKPVAYDWRLSLDDLLAQGAHRGNGLFYGEATSSPYIEQTLRSLAGTSKTGKVTIIAHSNGGLVAKALLQKLGPAETARLVDKVVLVSVPQSGSAEDVALMLFGRGGSLPFDSCATIPILGNFCAGLVHRDTARTFAEHAPAAYHLLPSAAYFKGVSDGRHHVIEFNASHAYAAERALYKSGINSLAELHAFLAAKEGGRSKPAAADVAHANVLTEANLLAYASTTHAHIDEWVPPAAVEVYQIAGTGNTTLSGIDFYDYSLLGGAGVRALYRPLFTFEGDGLVQARSAMQIKSGPNVHDYWIQFDKMGGPFSAHDHSDEFEAFSLRRLLGNVLAGRSEIPSDIVSVRPLAATLPKRMILILHSPLTLEAYDSSDRHVGPNLSGTFDRQIPFSAYGELGDTKYIAVPAEGTYRIVLRGITAGSFTLDVRQMENDVPIETTSLAEIPATPATRATMTVQDGALQPLEVDEDGDGGVDFTLEPKAGSTVQYKAPAPIVAAIPISPLPPPLPISAPAPLPAAAATSTGTVLGTSTVSVPVEETARFAAKTSATPTPAEVAAAQDNPASSTAEETSTSTAPAAVLLAVPHSFIEKILQFFYDLVRSILHRFLRW